MLTRTMLRRSSMGSGITLAELLLVGFIFATVSGLTWTVHYRRGWMLAREKANESTIPERRKRIEALIARTHETVEFRLVAGAAGGQPVVGVPVRMRVKQATFTKNAECYSESDAEGRVRFERVPEGEFVVSFHPQKAFWGETGLSLTPGMPVARTVIVPSRAEISIVGVKVHWPQDIAARTPQFIFGMDNLQLDSLDPESVVQTEWKAYDPVNAAAAGPIRVNEAGEMLRQPWSVGIRYLSGGRRGSRSPYLSRLSFGPTSFEPLPKLAWPDKDYRVVKLGLVVPLSHRQPQPLPDEQIELVWIDSANWDHQFETTPNGTILALRPTDASLRWIRSVLLSIDKTRERADGTFTPLLRAVPNMRAPNRVPAESGTPD